jgi:peptide/nickel transport system substrate-binding protein
MAIALGGHGTGPYHAAARDGAVARLSPPPPESDEAEADGPPGAPPPPDIALRGEDAARAIIRFLHGDADLVTGGTIGDLPYARRADVPASRFALDPVQGLFGLVFLNDDGPLAQASVRRALAMAIDREGIAAEPLLAGFEPRVTIAPTGIDELPDPARPDWADQPLAARRPAAAAAIREAGAPVRLRVAVPDTPGDRLIFAHLRRDWAAIGVSAVAAPAGGPADLAFVDMIAPMQAGAWYLRRFMCAANPVCDADADTALDAARTAPDAAARRAALANADRILAGLTPYIALGRPLRWSLATQRLNGFRPNIFGRHPAVTLIVAESS